MAKRNSFGRRGATLYAGSGVQSAPVRRVKQRFGLQRVRAIAAVARTAHQALHGCTLERGAPCARQRAKDEGLHFDAACLCVVSPLRRSAHLTCPHVVACGRDAASALCAREGAGHDGRAQHTHTVDWHGKGDAQGIGTMGENASETENESETEMTGACGGGRESSCEGSEVMKSIDEGNGRWTTRTRTTAGETKQRVNWNEAWKLASGALAERMAVAWHASMRAFSPRLDLPPHWLVLRLRRDKWRQRVVRVLPAKRCEKG
eukprot:3469034-Pleurochrysis_carterae.AAC.1